MAVAYEEHAGDVRGQDVCCKGGRGKLPQHVEPAGDPAQNCPVRVVVGQLHAPARTCQRLPRKDRLLTMKGA